MRDISLKAAVYCTISSGTGNQNAGVLGLKEHFYQTLEKRKYEIAQTGILCKQDGTREALSGIYADENSGGLGLQGRPAFQQLIKDAADRKYDVLVINDKDLVNEQEIITVLKEIYGLGIYIFIESTEDTPIHRSQESDLFITLNDYLAQTRQQHIER